MPHFMVDDQLFANTKAKRLVDLAEHGDLRGMAAGFLWTLSGSQTQASGTNGAISRRDVLRLVLDAELAHELPDLLVSVGLWHGEGHQCRVCPQPSERMPGAAWVFHDFFQMGYDTAAQVKEGRAKRRELKDAALTNAVWARDCLDPSKPWIAACRYCGKTVNRKDTRSPDDRPTLDHVDPALAAGIRNLVVACRACNQMKGRRTPAQAGMRLLPPPRSSNDDPTSQIAVSRPVGPAETPQSSEQASDSVSRPPGPAEARTDRETTSRTTPGTTSGTSEVTTVVGRPCAGARAGSGLGKGSGEGDQQGEAREPRPSQPSSRSRRRRRGRGRAASPQGPPPRTEDPVWDAGDAVVPEGPGRFGSPFHRWSGPPSEVDAESRCPEHGCNEPCQRCLREVERGER